jgi:preprotein translocase subunit SecG
MNILETGVLILHLLVAVAICGFVLLQHGKGADMGAAFGSGSSGSLFGAAGSANFLSRTTAILAAVFFASSLGLTWFGSTKGAPSTVMQKGVMEKMAPKASDVPSAPGANPASAPAGTTGTTGTTGAAGAPPAAEPAKAAAPPSPDGSKSGEVPK